MSLYLECEACSKEINNPGAALLFSPPKEAIVEKKHICVGCYKNILKLIKKIKEKSMGYEVDVELRDIKFKVSSADKVITVLKELNKVWLKESDWCRFDSYLKTPIEIFENIGFELEAQEDYYVVTEFLRQNLGDHENVFKQIAPYLEDGEVAFFGEDGCDWKIVIKDGKSERIIREAF